MSVAHTTLTVRDICTFAVLPGEYPLYGLYRYVRTQREGFFGRFGHK